MKKDGSCDICKFGTTKEPYDPNPKIIECHIKHPIIKIKKFSDHCSKFKFGEYETELDKELKKWTASA